MKATSKIISVVLILAMCLSIFTVSAFAEQTTIITAPMENEANEAVITTDGSYNGGSESEEDDDLAMAENVDENSLAVTNVNVAPADGSVKVADYAGLDAALKAKAPAITLTAKVPVAGPLTLDYAVKLDLGGQGRGLDFSGSGTAAVISTAEGVELTNGNLFVFNAASVDEDGNAVGGFKTVASGSVKMTDVHIWDFAGEGSLFGEGVNFVSGTTSKALHEGDVATGNRFVYEVKEEKTEETADEPVESTESAETTESAESTESAEPTEPVEPAGSDESAELGGSADIVEASETSELSEPAESTESTEPAEAPANEDPVTVEKPEDKELVGEVRVDEAAQLTAEEEKTSLTATDEVTGAVVTVTGFLPEGLTLIVKHIDTGLVGGLAEGEVALLAVDISLVDADGNEYEPVNNPDANFRAVSVMISHPSLAGIAEDETLVLYHVEEEGTSQVASATSDNGSDTMNFSTGSFSPFIIAVKKGEGTADTGSEGEVHKKTIKITNLSGETYVKGSGGLEFRITGGSVPESISIIDPDNVSSGNLDVYKAGYLIYGKNPSKGHDYYFLDVSDPEKNPNADPCTVHIFDQAINDAPTGKWAVVFWFKDTTDSGSTRVYMVQYVNIVQGDKIKGVGYNFDEATGTYEVEKCDYDALQVLLTDDLLRFSIVGIDGITYASYDRNVSEKKMWVHVGGKDKQVYIGEYFTVSDYVTEDAIGHEFVAGKSLKIHDALVKLLPYGDGHTLTVEQENKDPATYKHYDKKIFKINVSPGITVADGLVDYIKGKNVWIKFISCEPIDYDADGTLAIWIGGQKISHDYYSISNDHKTLWIYRNLLDQLKSNNSYTLTARLWGFVKDPITGEKVKQTWYPATASFNILAAGSTSYRSPKTGDESNVALWAAVLLLSGGAVVALIPKKKKSK